VIACAAYPICLSILSWLIVVWSLQRRCRLARKPGCKEYVIQLVRFTSLNIGAKGGGRAAKILRKVESTWFGQRHQLKAMIFLAFVQTLAAADEE
jgi:hypothetical protein